MYMGVNTKFNFEGIGWKGVEWIHVAQASDHWWDSVNIIMKWQVP
jgi:hypothetical protein